MQVGSTVPLARTCAWGGHTVVIGPLSSEDVPHSAELSAASMLTARMERLPWTLRHWGVLGSLFTATFFDGYDTAIVNSALPLLMAALHLPLTSAAVLVSSSFWGQSIGSPIAGYVAERWGRRSILMLACVIMGGMALVTVFTQSFEQLLIARALQGIGMGMEVPIAGALVNDFLPTKRRGMLAYTYETAFSWGGRLAPLIALAGVAVLGQDQSWRLMFGFAALSIVMVVVRKWFLPESPRWLITNGQFDQAEKVISSFEDSARKRNQELREPVPSAVPTQVQRTRYLEIFSPEYRKRTIVLLLWVGGSYAVTYGFTPLVSTLYVSIGGLTPVEAVTVTAVTTWIGLMWPYVTAWGLDRMGRRLWFGWGPVWNSLWLLAAGGVVGALAIHSWIPMVVCAQIGTLGGTVSLGVYTYVPENFPARMRAWMTSLASTMIRLLSSFMPVVFALVLQGPLGIFGAYTLAAALMAVSGVVVVLWGKETKGQTLEEASYAPVSVEESTAGVPSIVPGTAI
jgi:putative MFS transporter